MQHRRAIVFVRKLPTTLSIENHLPYERIPYPPEYYYTCYFACDNSTVGRNILTNNFVKASHSGRDALSKQSNGLFVAKAGSNL